jgi:hypothetical protein
MSLWECVGNCDLAFYVLLWKECPVMCRWQLPARRGAMRTECTTPWHFKNFKTWLIPFRSQVLMPRSIIYFISYECKVILSSVVAWNCLQNKVETLCSDLLLRLFYFFSSPAYSKHEANLFSKWIPANFRYIAIWINWITTEMIINFYMNLQKERYHWCFSLAPKCVSVS